MPSRHKFQPGFDYPKFESSIVIGRDMGMGHDVLFELTHKGSYMCTEHSPPNLNGLEQSWAIKLACSAVQDLVRLLFELEAFLVHFRGHTE